MKKNIFLVAIMAFVGMANAQMVKPTELVSNYASYDGKNIAVSNFTGTVITKPNTKNVNEPASNSLGAITGNIASSVPKTPFCKTLKGFKIVEFTATGSQNCGCFYIPSNMVTKFQDIKKSGAKMMVRVSIDSKSKVNKITGLDSQ